MTHAHGRAAHLHAMDIAPARPAPQGTLQAKFRRVLNSYGVPDDPDWVPQFASLVNDLEAAAREHLAAEAHPPVGDFPGRDARHGVVGHLTVTVDLVKDSEPASWENPAEGDTTWLTLGDAVVVAHDLDEHHLRWLASEAHDGDLDPQVVLLGAVRDLTATVTPLGQDDDGELAEVINLFGRPA